MSTTETMGTTMRDEFVRAVTHRLDTDSRTALVLADISGERFTTASARHPDRVINVGIREQLMIGTAGGLALAGMRPIAHSYAPFLVERPFEQIKLSLSHQGAAALLVSIGASFDASTEGRTHQSPGDVALLDTLPGWQIHVPGHPTEVAPLIQGWAGDRPTYIRLSDSVNTEAGPATGDGSLRVLRLGKRGLVIAVGPMADPVLEAVRDLDLTVAYAVGVRPFDVAGLRTLADGVTVDGGQSGRGSAAPIVLVEPYLAGTSSRLVDGALADRPHRTLALGVGRTELRRYGTPADHAAWHGLDPAGLRRAITEFL